MKKILLLTTLSILFSCNSTSNINTSPKINEKNTGTTGQLIERHVVSGFIFDKDNKPISDAIIKIKILNNISNNNISSYEFKTSFDGMYYFKNILENTDIELTVSKNGYRTIIKKDNINSSKYLKGIYYINFITSNTDSSNIINEVSSGIVSIATISGLVKDKNGNILSNYNVELERISDNKEINNIFISESEKEFVFRGIKINSYDKPDYFYLTIIKNGKELYKDKIEIYNNLSSKLNYFEIKLKE